LEHPEGRTWIKVAWGTLVGLAAWIMISFAEVDGIRMLSNLGGFPAACFLLFVLAALARVSANPARFDQTGHPSETGNTTSDGCVRSEGPCENRASCDPTSSGRGGTGRL